MPEYKMFSDLNLEEQQKILLYLDKFWPMAENLDIPDLKIDETEKCLESCLMGFLPPEECLRKIKDLLETYPKKGEVLSQKINSEIFSPLEAELSKMYKTNINQEELEKRPEREETTLKTLGEELGLSK